jgi:hypothetical protein
MLINLINPSFIFARFAHTAGDSYKTLFPAGASDRSYGVYSVSCTNTDAFVRSYKAIEGTWTGAAETWTVKVDNSLTANAVLLVNAGNIDVKYTDASNRAEVGIQVKLNGMALIYV